MSKIMLITYNDVVGVPIGRYETEKVIVYSGNYGRDAYAGIPHISQKQTNAAERVVAELKQSIAKDLDIVHIVFVYVGAAALQGSTSLVRDLIEKGKEVRMVACDCAYDQKNEIKETYQIEWIACECGGEFTCSQIIQDINNDLFSGIV